MTISSSTIRQTLLVLGLGLLLIGATVAEAQNFGEWGPAASVDPLRVNDVNTSFNDGCPIESPDGHMLFFASDRSGNLDIWVAYRDKESDPWGSSVALPAPVNTPAKEFCPTPLPGNGLLFVSTRANNCGGAGNNPDIYYTRLHPVLGWLPPQPLSCDVNSGAEEWSPSLVEAEGVTMLFFSSTRTGTQKIYSSALSPDGSWGPAIPVYELNWDGAQDARPNLRKDGLEIVFDSTRGGGTPHIYTASRSSIFDPWSAPVLLGPNVNSTSSETRASLSRDGERLYFGSGRANRMGDSGSDIFVSERSRPGNSHKSQHEQ
jgi:Tol biopolymer transport system component